MTQAAARLGLIFLIVATIGCDRVTKHAAAAALAEHPARSFMMDIVRLEYAENTGGFLGLGEDWPPAVRTGVFTIANAMLLLGVIVVARRDGWSGPLLVGAALFVTGGASNLADRVFRGSVIDFLNVGVGPLRTGIFNAADVAIMLGLTMVAVVTFNSHHTSRRRI
jgi:signal peptidase II